jgi:hypothetical protein
MYSSVRHRSCATGGYRKYGSPFLGNKCSLNYCRRFVSGLSTPVTCSASLNGTCRSQVVFFTGGVVFLTLVINGSTTKRLLRLLGMDTLTESKVRTRFSCGAKHKGKKKNQKQKGEDKILGFRHGRKDGWFLLHLQAQSTDGVACLHSCFRTRMSRRSDDRSLPYLRSLGAPQDWRTKQDKQDNVCLSGAVRICPAMFSRICLALSKLGPH